MFAIQPYPHDYSDLLRAVQQLHTDQARLDALRTVFDQRSTRRKPKSLGCEWLRCNRPAIVKTRPVRHYLREWGQDPDNPPKKRQRRAQSDGAAELKPGKTAKPKPISASKDSAVFLASDEQIGTISRLWQSGATAKQIGEQVGMTYQAVSRLIRAHGMTRPEKPRSRAAKATDAQIADVIRQCNEGVRYSAIAAATGLTYPQVLRIAHQNAQQAAQ